MPPQADKTQSLDDHENIDRSLPDPNPNVFNGQKYLLILLFIQWFTFIITLGVGIYLILFGNTTDVSSGIQSLIPVIVLVIYYTFGLLVTSKQHRVGLLIFASIGVVLFIVVFIFVGYIFLAIIALSVGFGDSSQGSEVLVLIGILFIVMSIVVVMTLKLSFNLAKSIKKNEYLTV